MLRAAGRTKDGKPFVMLGLTGENLGLLREGKPIAVNLRNLDPGQPPIEQLPDLELFIYFAGGDELQQIEKMFQHAEAMTKKEHVCKRCGVKESVMWWKCCPEHTTEFGPDVMCDDCAKKLHQEEDLHG